MNDQNLLEITEKQAITSYDNGKVIYIQCSGTSCDTSMNTFIMRKDIKDGSLNMHLMGRKPADVPLQEYIAFIKMNQAEPLRFFTFNSDELYTLPITGNIIVDVYYKY